MTTATLFTPNNRTRRWVVAVGALLLCAQLAAVFAARSLTAWSDAIDLASGLLAVGSGLLAFRRSQARAWLLFAAGCLLWSIAQGMFSFVNHLTDRMWGVPSPADPVFLASIPFLMIGVNFITMRFSHWSRRLYGATSGLMLGGSLLFIAYVLVIHRLNSTGSELVDSTIYALYPIADTVLFGFALIALRYRDSTTNRWMIGGAFSLLLADGAFLLSQAGATIVISGYYDVLWVAAMAAFAVAAASADPDSDTPILDIEHNPISVVVLLVPVVAAFGVGVWATSQENGIGTVGALIAGSVVAGIAGTITALEARSRNLTSALTARYGDLAVERQRFDRILNNQSDGVVITDEAGDVRWMSRRAVELMPGLDEPGPKFIERFTPHDRREIEAVAPTRHGDVSSAVVAQIGGAEDATYVEVVVANAVDDHAILGLVYSLRDVTWRVAQDRRLGEAQAQFERVIEQAPVAMALTDTDGVVVRANAALCTMLGVPSEALIGQPLDGFMHRSEVDAARTLAQQLLDGGRESFQFEQRFTHASGRIVWGSVNGRTIEFGRQSVVLRQIDDITERRHAVEQLEYAARHDSLTELPNRRLFIESLHNELHVTGQRVNVLFCDLDNFKVINDSLGHTAGDELLRIAAARLGGCVRPNDLVARFGGDEFVIMVAGVDDLVINRLVERVEAALLQPIRLRGQDVYVTVSIGIASGQALVTTPEDMIRDADVAMYRAKERGRARAEWFDESSIGQVRKVHRLGNELRKSVSQGEFEVAYQPVVDLTTGSVVSVEALLRWPKAPTGVTIADVIRAAEDGGMIAEIGRFVAHRAFRQAAEWRQELGASGDVLMTVNMSAREAVSERYVSDLRNAFEGAGLPPTAVAVELTETALLADAERAEVTLRQLADLGVTVIVDDFGTGHASLVYLRRMPFSRLKIDRLFVDGMMTEQSDEAIVDAVLSLSKTLGLEVIAEGVETQAQLDRLRAKGCRYGQGYLLGRPLPAPEIAAMLRSATLLAQLGNDE